MKSCEQSVAHPEAMALSVTLQHAVPTLVSCIHKAQVEAAGRDYAHIEIDKIAVVFFGSLG